MKRHNRPRPRGGDSTEESLRGKNRELQKTIRQLQQRVRQLEKQLGLRSTLPEEEAEEKTSIEARPKTIICDNCGKGEMEEYILEGPGKMLIFLTCKLCKHRKKAK